LGFDKKPLNLEYHRLREFVKLAVVGDALKYVKLPRDPFPFLAPRPPRGYQAPTMTLLYHDPLFLEHDTGPRHPERPQRLISILSALKHASLLERCVQPSWLPASPAQLALVHHPAYVAQIADFASHGGGRLDADTVASAQSYDAAALAAGATCDAVRRVLDGEARQALCLVRPPGHHALADAAMGFCLFGNVALAARTATRELGLDHVLIVDFDVHHGNGTQAIFWDDPQVSFLSIHRWPFYPGSGSREETGTGSALGTKVNLPIEFGTSRSDYLAQFETALAHLAARTKPDLVLISAGFDAHRADPVGSLGLETDDYASLTRLVVEAAGAYAAGKVVSVLEGGYDVGTLADCVQLHLETMLALDQ
jgi:acetoin utilization deacetylase AcuC-like enzyme